MGCYHAGTQTRDGIKLCHRHAHGRGAQWARPSRAPSPKGRTRSESPRQRPRDPWYAFVRGPFEATERGQHAYYRYPAQIGEDVPDDSSP